MATTTPTWQDLKAFLRLQTSAEDGGLDDTPAGAGNGLLARLIDRAVGRAERIIGVPIDARQDVFVVDNVDRFPTPKRAFHVPARSIEPASPAPVVVDAYGMTVPTSQYRVETDTGLFLAAHGRGWWDRFPYTVTLTWGLSTEPDYEIVTGPDLAQAIIDLAAHWHQQRNAGAASEGAGGGVTATYVKDEVPPRVMEVFVGHRRVPA